MSTQTWALVLGVVAVVLSGFILLSGHLGTENPPKTDFLLSELPDEVAGFDLQENLPRIDPLLEGERYSSLVSFVPAQGALFEGKVGHIGVMLYHFESEAWVEPALAIVSLGNALRSFPFRGHTLLKYVDETTGQITLFFPHKAALLQILAVPPTQAGDSNLADVEAAALQLMDAVIQSQPREKEN